MIVSSSRRWPVLAFSALVLGTPACSKDKNAEGTATPTGGGSADSPANAAESLFADGNAPKAVEAMKRKIGGGIRALELVIYPGYTKLQAENPAKKNDVGEYEFRDGSVDDPTPVKIYGGGNLDANLFDLDPAVLGVVPQMVKDAPPRLAIPDGKVTHVTLKRGLPFTQEVRFRVFVSGASKNGSVEYDEKGAMKKVWSD
jgi:hypothetical protein